jgi:hypothetical protein
MQDAACNGHVPVLEVLCEHAPATLEAKAIVRLSVFVCIPLTQVVGMQDGWTPLHYAAFHSNSSAVKYITDRVPYQVLERTNAGTCRGECYAPLTGVGEQARHPTTSFTNIAGHQIPPALLCAAPASCASRRPWSFHGGPILSIRCFQTTSR